MTIVGIRTDKPIAELYIVKDGTVVDTFQWEAHRQLAETIHRTIEKLLLKNDTRIGDVDGIVFYNSGASFTGIRIGATIANAFAASLGIPVVGCGSKQWLSDGVTDIESGSIKLGKYIDPHYSAPVFITKPKK